MSHQHLDAKIAIFPTNVWVGTTFESLGTHSKAADMVTASSMCAVVFILHASSTPDAKIVFPIEMYGWEPTFESLGLPKQISGWQRDRGVVTYFHVCSGFSIACLINTRCIVNISVWVSHRNVWVGTYF